MPIGEHFGQDMAEQRGLGVPDAGAPLGGNFGQGAPGDAYEEAIYAYTHKLLAPVAKIWYSKDTVFPVDILH